MALSFILVATAIKSIRRTYAQSCPAIPPAPAHWPEVTEIRYSFDSSWGLFHDFEKSQVNQAIQNWGNANVVKNGTGVTFAPADDTHPATLTFRLGPTVSPNNFAESDIRYSFPSYVVTNVIVTFALNNIFADGARMYDPTLPGASTFITKAALHELGHAMGLGDSTCNSSLPNCGWSGQSVMNGSCQTNDQGRCGPSDVQQCDNTAVSNRYWTPPPDDPAPFPPGPDCTIAKCSPIILAVGPSADYKLTSPQDGVLFDLTGSGAPQRFGWTHANEAVGFLAMDRNHNGIIDSGRELFGNFTPLGSGQTAADGWQALAFFDHPENGGNGNGWIDPGDSVWSSLLIWIDLNHDGVSQPNELFPLSAFHITAISTTAHRETRRDAFGNQFRLRGEFVIDGHLRPAYDVYLAAAPGLVGVAKDATRAAELYQRACDGGDATGCRSLGLVYETGAGVAKDKGRALQFYRQACVRGDSEACAAASRLGKQSRN